VDKWVLLCYLLGIQFVQIIHFILHVMSAVSCDGSDGLLPLFSMLVRAFEIEHCLTLRFRASHIRPGRYLNSPLYFAAYALIQVGKVYISNLLHVRGHFWPASRSDRFTPGKNPRSNIEEPLSIYSGSIRMLRNLFCTVVELVCLQSTENNRLVKAWFTCTRVLYHMAELDIGVVIHTSFLLCSWL
jgi:hypothetical protein